MARADITVGYTMFMFLKFNMIKLFIFILAILFHTLANARVFVPMEEIEACFFAGPGGIATEFGAGVASALQVPAVATPFVSGIAAAGAKSVLIQGGLGLLNHQGNVFKAVEDLGKPQGLKSLALAGLTGGLMEGASLHLKLPKQPQTFAGHFQKAAV
ncbi:MAG: DUF637 domain-containing protein, partial [Cetobacterium sp.]